MSKIYVVTTGEYSDYQIRGIYWTPEKAKIAQALYAGDIAELELDEMPKHPRGKLLFEAKIPENGKIEIRVKDVTDRWRHWMDARGIEVHLSGKTVIKALYSLYIWAKDESHALRRASEKRARMITSGIWQREVERAKRREARRE